MSKKKGSSSSWLRSKLTFHENEEEKKEFGSGKGRRSCRLLPTPRVTSHPAIKKEEHQLDFGIKGQIRDKRGREEKTRRKVDGRSSTFKAPSCRSERLSEEDALCDHCHVPRVQRRKQSRSRQWIPRPVGTRWYYRYRETAATGWRVSREFRWMHSEREMRRYTVFPLVNTVGT